MAADPPAAASAPEDDPPGTGAQRWLARLSFVLAAAAAAIVPIFAGLKSLAMLAAGLAAVVVSLASGYLFLARRGLLRWLSLAVFILAPAAVVALYAFTGLLWVALAGAAGWLIAGTTLQRTAEDLGAEVFLLSGPEPADVAEVARKAVATGADLLGVAGGDGTQALVAGVAAHYGLPFVVIPAGTRNHFALDLGLDRDDPADSLDVLPDLLQGHRGARLAACAADTQISSAQTVLVSNNSYGTADLAGLGRRVRLDRGVLAVVGVGATPPQPPVTWARLRKLAAPRQGATR
jgi:hypothetical protein